MPSHRIHGSTVDLKLYDVLGEDRKHNFIGHMGLAAQEGSQFSGAVPCIHMGPPLATTNAQMKVDACGEANLGDSERRKIQNFIERHEGEHAAAERIRQEKLYCIFPHATPFLESDGRYTRTRFSCVGFVYEAYRKARINLLDESAIPEVGLDTLKDCYPDFAEKLDNPAFRDAMGLSGTANWPVMLCGYLLHSLNRTAKEIRSTPYVPKKTDAYFH